MSSVLIGKCSLVFLEATYGITGMLKVCLWVHITYIQVLVIKLEYNQKVDSCQ